ncbi:putative CocE/NonD family hydrolase [Evansella vedderi]|uniref:CocE/NonD family hydrolase n=1 Tax=Evansella vedderi TaxID=38282 RepID=A0ABT9ZNR3_9BACI|nr:CocE/NonD family hydrolase [Evansella vedderi]MDQ0252862.1 putative CocE/NonD family hydrolase [Evansella vedderi]
MNENTEVLIERDVPCTVRDGVKLYANIYRPNKAGTYPVLLTRLPYNKNLPDFSHRYIDPIRAVLADYVVIIQDVRGRFASEGNFEPFVQEAEDGYDTVEWAARLPYSNGKVGMFGLSYYGFTQLYAAIEQPPSLKAIFPAMTGNDLRDGLLYRSGVFELGLFETWMLDSVAPDYLKRKQGIDNEETMKQLNHDLNHIDEWYKYVPIKDWPPLTKHPDIGDLFTQYTNQELSNDLFERTSFKEDLKKLDLPAFHLAGWYDCFLGPTLTNYEEMSKNEKGKRKQKLIIGPWGHGMFESVNGERFFGVNSSGHSIEGKNDLTLLHLKWFDEWLKEKPTSVMEEDPVKIFVMGINEWRFEKEWPIQRTEYIPYYLHSNGDAAKGIASGGLDETPTKEEPTDQFIFDPKKPVPTKGGNPLFYLGLNSGPLDQREIESREDVLVYTSAPMEQQLEVTGRVKMVLWAATDAPDTDFTVKLVDVFPDGRAYILTDGIVRAKYRDGYEVKPELAGEVVKYEIDLWATSNVFLPGHSIRIEVSSSNFPRYDVNPNTGQSLIETTESKKATQTIYHQVDYPSYLLLPVIR